MPAYDGMASLCKLLELLAPVGRPLSEIVGELDSADKHVKGLALEAFAFRLMWLVGLRYQGTRVAGVQTGGAMS